MWPFSAKSQSPHFRWVDDDFAVSGQIDPHDITKLAESGFKTIVCARPDREDVNQPDFTEIATAALKVGLKAVHIPISSGIGEGHLIRMEGALRDLPRPMLGYCRSGARAGSLYGAAKRSMA